MDHLYRCIPLHTTVSCIHLLVLILIHCNNGNDNDNSQEVTIKDRAVSTYHRLMRTEERQYRADMEMACEADAIIHLLAERSYYAARRQSHATLPGMQSHYPNPNYPVPALLLPGVRFIRPPKDTKTSAFEMIFGKKVVSSKFALPVGRKPAPAVLQQYNELIVAGELQEVQHMVRVVGADGTNEPEEEVDAAGDADEEEEFLIASKKILPADTLTSGKDFRTEGDQHISVVIILTFCFFLCYFASPTDTATVDAIAETAEEGKAAAQPAAKTKKHGSRHRRAAKKRRNAVFLTIGRPPAEVYLGRRGMYPRAPGLEEYIDSLRSETLRAVEAEAVRKKALDRRDTSTAYAKSMRSEQMSRKDESERLVARELVTREFEKAERIRKLELKKGLITRFRVNVSLKQFFSICCEHMCLCADWFD